MQLTDLTFGHGHQPHVSEGELLEQTGRAIWSLTIQTTSSRRERTSSRSRW